jgi:hypothetical protein
VSGGRPFHVLLTTYEMLMGKSDRPRLARLSWRHIIIDEGHRLKNAGCKLNSELRHYRASAKLLLTGGGWGGACGPGWAAGRGWRAGAGAGGAKWAAVARCRHAAAQRARYHRYVATQP